MTTHYQLLQKLKNAVSKMREEQVLYELIKQ